MWLLLNTLTKYRTVFIIQVLNTKYIFSVGVSTTFWSGGASTMLAKRGSWAMCAAITYIWISQLQSQLLRLHLHVHSDRQALWTREDKKVQSLQLINVDSTDMLFIFPKLLGKGSRHLQGHFLLQERKWVPLWLNSLVTYEGLIAGWNKSQSWRTDFWLREALKSSTEFIVAGKTDFLDLVLHWVMERV